MCHHHRRPAGFCNGVILKESARPIHRLCDYTMRQPLVPSFAVLRRVPQK